MINCLTLFPFFRITLTCSISSRPARHIHNRRIQIQRGDRFRIFHRIINRIKTASAEAEKICFFIKAFFLCDILIKHFHKAYGFRASVHVADHHICNMPAFFKKCSVCIIKSSEKLCAPYPWFSRMHFFRHDQDTLMAIQFKILSLISFPFGDPNFFCFHSITSIIHAHTSHCCISSSQSTV